MNENEEVKPKKKRKVKRIPKGREKDLERKQCDPTEYEPIEEDLFPKIDEE